MNMCAGMCIDMCVDGAAALLPDAVGVIAEPVAAAADARNRLARCVEHLRHFSYRYSIFSSTIILVIDIAPQRFSH